jgi:hypothetical protein
MSKRGSRLSRRIDALQKNCQVERQADRMVAEIVHCGKCYRIIFDFGSHQQRLFFIYQYDVDKAANRDHDHILRKKPAIRWHNDNRVSIDGRKTGAFAVAKSSPACRLWTGS